MPAHPHPQPTTHRLSSPALPSLPALQASKGRLLRLKTLYLLRLRLRMLRLPAGGSGGSGSPLSYTAAKGQGRADVARKGRARTSCKIQERPPATVGANQRDKVLKNSDPANDCGGVEEQRKEVRKVRQAS